MPYDLATSEMQNYLSRIWQHLPGILFTLIFGYLAIKIIRAGLNEFIKVTRGNKAMKGIILSLVDILLWVLLMAALMHQLGLTQVSIALSSLVAFAGLALSAGSSAIIQDLVSGLFLAQDPNLRIGERIKMGDVEGMVEKMDARKIRVRADNGNLYIVPNAVFDKGTWIAENEVKEG